MYNAEIFVILFNLLNLYISSFPKPARGLGEHCKFSLLCDSLTLVHRVLSSVLCIYDVWYYSAVTMLVASK